MARKNFPDSHILFVGNKKVSDNSVIIMRNLPKHIEHLPQFLTFCAWWAITHNNLFSDAKYLALFEWDTRPQNQNFWQDVNYALENSSVDALGLISSPMKVFWIDQSPTFKTAMQNLKLSYPKSNTWYSTSNTIINRKKLNEFVSLYETQLDVFKNDPKCKWAHERIYGLWLKTQNVKLVNGLIHFQAESHGKYKLQSSNKLPLFIMLLLIVILIVYTYHNYKK
jgi:hypothetical protein